MSKNERVVRPRKLEYRARLLNYLETYQNILIVGIDMVGSRQLQEVRLALRGRAQVLMGKNTIIRKVLRDACEEHPEYEPLLQRIQGNVGFIFTNEELAPLRKEIESNQVPAAARTGLLAPIDVYVPAGPTGLDPGQTGFFQALNIATKIVRGTIEIISQVHLITQGTKISPSAVSLLQKLNLKPFFFSIKTKYVSEAGSLYPVSILDMSDAELLGKFYNGVTKLASISLAANLPNMASIPHSFGRAFKNILALAVVSEFSFKEADKFKEYLADPAAYAAAHGLTAAAPAAAAAAAAPAAAAAVEEESEEEEMEFDLFG